MSDNISTILEKLYKNELRFNDACDEISNLLIKKTSEEIYKEITNDN